MADWEKYWGAVGVGGLLAIGALLFFFPEPMTSVVGMSLILIAAVIWLAGWYRERGNTTTADTRRTETTTAETTSRDDRY